MARTLAEIKAEIEFTKAQQSELDVYNNVSLVGRLNLLIYVVAYVIWLHEKIFDNVKAEIDQAARANLSGTNKWYAEQIYRFQFGDAVELIDGLPGYAVIDATKQIVKRAAVNNTATPGLIDIKVAKLDGAGAPTPLDAPELAALQSYIEENIGYAGTAYNFINEAADVLAITADIYFDAQYTLATTEQAVKDAIDAYLANISFDGKYRVQRLTDAIQAVVGVTDVRINTVIITDYTAAVTTNPQTQVFAAGYAVAGAVTLNMIAE